MILRPFFSFYGAKWRAAKYYPAPVHERLIEPFAGSAGYATRFPERQVLLNDLDPYICGVWDFLIHASEGDINHLPTVVEHIDEVNASQEAKWLIGFWLNNGATAPCKTLSAWGKEYTSDCNFWGAGIKQRLITQVPFIRHWKVSNVSYDSLENDLATWFVDPPYTQAGKHYRMKFDNPDMFDDLAGWCKKREGQVIVCEADGADWLPFQPFKNVKSNPSSRGKRISKEVVWYSQ